MNKVYVEDESFLKRFYDASALTVEGLSEDSLDDYYQWLKDNVGAKDDLTFYITSGEYMNSEYGSNYPNDLTIVIVELKDIGSVTKLATKRFEFGGRWFDDVVDNILR
jgi:hypothetical protein